MHSSFTWHWHILQTAGPQCNGTCCCNGILTYIQGSQGPLSAMQPCCTRQQSFSSINNGVTACCINLIETYRWSSCKNVVIHEITYQPHGNTINLYLFAGQLGRGSEVPDITRRQLACHCREGRQSNHSSRGCIQPSQALTHQFSDFPELTRPRNPCPVCTGCCRDLLSGRCLTCSSAVNAQTGRQ